ncbi:hypothetical protein C8R42DRAFT_687717 [Lentinula raphanica]|nr:hypothetical protein C8R42DRAFT_687717 [Lentinula raphanica]
MGLLIISAYHIIENDHIAMVEVKRGKESRSYEDACRILRRCVGAAVAGTSFSLSHTYVNDNR